MTDQMDYVPRMLYLERELMGAALRVAEAWDGEQEDALEKLYDVARRYREALARKEG